MKYRRKKINYYLRKYFKKSKYFIDSGYIHRETVMPFDDTNFTDEYQNEVYEYAKRHVDESNYDKIIDLGCGSGYKLIKYFEDKYTIGFEVQSTLEFLIKKYPSRDWRSIKSFDIEYICDVLICADVIEHVSDPVAFIEELISNFDFKCLLMSTPVRKKITDAGVYGPPLNEAHYREWTFEEFNKLMAQYFIINDHFISNDEQGTQAVWCTKLAL